MRINEDYMEVIDRDDIANDSALSMDVRQNVQWLLNSHHTNIDFNIIDRPVYKVKNHDELKFLIEKTIEVYGPECNLNWIDVS